MEKIIGIIGAMEEEVEKLIAQTDVTVTENVAGMEFRKGRLGGTEVVIVRSGMGKVNAAMCAQILISRYNATHLINTGFAGSLSNDLSIGDIVISSEAVQHDFDVSPIGFKKGEVPFTGLVAFTADDEVVKTACKVMSEALPDVRIIPGRICSGDQFISDKKAKDRICSEFGGLCCEMEGAAVAQVSYLNNVKFLIIRAVSDSADESAGEDFNFSVFQSSVAEEFASAVTKLLPVV